MLSEVSTIEKVWGLPSPAPIYSILSPVILKPALFREVKTCSIPRALVRDRWGRQILSLPLEQYSTVRTAEVHPSRSDKVKELDPQLSLLRTKLEESGVACSFSDGSELVCDGVIYCDGPASVGRKMLVPSRSEVSDPDTVTCWSFVRRDLLSPNGWEFRTALGKSVEQLPLPEGQVRVKLRFRSKFGARQTAAQLRDLFSEFGPDMEALLEGVEADEIVLSEERSPSQITFCPSPGAVALGEAAIGTPILGTFNWAARAARRQLERVVESILAENWEPSAYEPHAREVLEPILKSERYFRRALQYDNVLLRPLRDLLLRLTPESFVRERVRSRLVL